MTRLCSFKGGKYALLAAIVLVAAGLLALKPWADSVLTATLTIRTDDAPSEVVFHARQFFSEGEASPPIIEAEVDLERWAGKLVKFDVDGSVGHRSIAGSSTGYVACEAELVTAEGTSPVEFLSWQHGAEHRLHMRPVGPRAYALDGEGGDRFAFATKGSLWHCLWVPESARLRVRLKAVPTARLTGALKPYAAAIERDPPSARMPVRRPDPLPDVYVYSVDALRPDHLGCYGYGRGTSPEIDAFAKEATLFEGAYTPTPWTRPSVATMVSGLYPSVHGVMHFSERLAEWPVLLPEVLREAGYATACFTTNLHIGENFGFNQGYDRFVLEHFGSAQWAVSQTADFLGALDPARPAFMFLHTLEPHDPYSPRAENLKRFDRGFQGRYDGTLESLETLRLPHPDMTREDIEHLIDRYDANIWEADEGFRNFLAELKEAGRYNNSLVVLVSDHGEAFMEHGTFSHAFDLSYESAQVVLIARFPGGRFAGVRVGERVSLVDLMPTILAQAGLRPDLPYELPGRDLSTLAAAPRGEPKRRIHGEISRWDGNEIDLLSIIDEDGYKRVIDVSVLPGGTATKESLGLWDMHSDPKEEHDLSQALPVRAAYDEQIIAEWLLEQRQWRTSLGAESQTANIGEALARELRALGYVGGGVGAAGE